MKKYFVLLLTLTLVVAGPLKSFAHIDHGRHYTEQDNLLRIDSDGVGGLLGMMSGTLLTLSTLDSSHRHYHKAMIQQAEADALDYQTHSVPTPAFMSAKATIEKLNNTTLTNEQAAVIIVEVNQKFRDQ